MAVPIKTFKLTEVKNPNIGEVKPADVRAHIEVDLRTMGGKIRDGMTNKNNLILKFIDIV